MWSEITNPVLNFPPNTHLLKVVQREKKKQQQQQQKVEETGERKKSENPWSILKWSSFSERVPCEQSLLQSS